MADTIINKVPVPALGINAHFQDRDAMRRGHPIHRFRLPSPAHYAALPIPPLPIDWTKGWTLQFPMYGNDTYGDCMAAASCHSAGTATGMNGTEWMPSQDSIISWYTKGSGGDNGL